VERRDGGRVGGWRRVEASLAGEYRIERAPAASKSRYLRPPKCHGHEESLLPLHLIGWPPLVRSLFLATGRESD
jgi:hypothetical protein